MIRSKLITLLTNLPAFIALWLWAQLVGFKKASRVRAQV
jgi:hypothetical protein